MKRRFFYVWMTVIIMTGIMVLGTSCTDSDEQTGTAKYTPVRYHFASKQEGQRLKLTNDDYFNSLSLNDIDWKTESTGMTLNEYKTLAAEQITDFTADEKEALSKVMDYIDSRLLELGIQLPMKDEIVFIKSKMGDEGGIGGYTHKNQIYLSEFVIERTTRAYQTDPAFDADYREYRILFAREIIAYEMFYCMIRNNPELRQQLYNLIGFSIMDKEVPFGPAVKNLLMHNPDTEQYDNCATFTIGGQKRRCILVGAYPGSYAEAVAVDPDANFFEDARQMLVPVDAPDTMIPISEATDFYSVMGQNVEGFFAAEECIAYNFSYLIAYGFNGRYDHWLEDEKLHFIPYQTPQLIRNIHELMQKLP